MFYYEFLLCSIFLLLAVRQVVVAVVVVWVWGKWGGASGALLVGAGFNGSGVGQCQASGDGGAALTGRGVVPGCVIASWSMKRLGGGGDLGRGVRALWLQIR